MKRKIAALLFGGMMLMMTASPALAQGTDRLRPVPPGTPPGQVGNDHENRPDNAVTPITGPYRDIERIEALSSTRVGV